MNKPTNIYKALLDRAHFDKVFKLQTIQRCFKACGSFASFFNMRGDRRYLKYLKRTLDTVAAELNDFEEYQTFSKVILENDLLEKNYIKLADEKGSA